MSDDADNRREFTRVRIHVEVEVSADDRATISGTVEDLSLNGAYVPCTGRLPVGTACKVELMLDGRDIRLSAEAQVSREDDRGIAVEFKGIPLDDLEHLRNLIRYNADDPNQVEEEFESHIGLKRREAEDGDS